MPVTSRLYSDARCDAAGRSHCFLALVTVLALTSCDLQIKQWCINQVASGTEQQKEDAEGALRILATNGALADQIKNGKVLEAEAKAVIENDASPKVSPKAADLEDTPAW